MSAVNPLEVMLFQEYENSKRWREYAWELERVIELQHRAIIDLQSDISLARARAYLHKHRHLAG